MASTQTVLHMVPGDGLTSYARNSVLQSSVQKNMKPMIQDAIASLIRGAIPLPGSIGIADLGCSSGPNAIALTSTAVDAVRRHCLQEQQQQTEICIHLNDLPNNDFNLVVKTMATYRQSQDSSGTVLANIVPGSFHGRLFSKCSLHLVCSTNSLHWLSKVPEDLVRNSIPLYDSDEAVRPARRDVVLMAYARQFEEDFTRFLGLRAQELVLGGQMVFSMLGRRSDDAAYKSIQHIEFVPCVLHEMASMGLIDAKKLDSFYIPIYGPSEREMREIIEVEGSFSINKMAIHVPSIAVGRGATPKTAAYSIRAALEPLILQHFGSSAEIMDEFVKIAERLMKAIPQDEYPCKPGDFLDVSLTRRI